MIWTRAERVPYKQVTIVTKQLIYCQSTQLYTHFLLRVFSVLCGNLIEFNLFTLTMTPSVTMAFSGASHHNAITEHYGHVDHAKKQ